MSSVSVITQPIIHVIRHEKKKILFCILTAAFCTLIFFPYDDLSDKITELITQGTQNQVFVQFDQLGIGFLPPSLKMTNVEVDTQFLPSAIKAKTLRLAPSIAGLLAFSPGFTANIDDVMNGNIDVTYRAGKKINNVPMQKIILDLSSVDINGLAKFAALPVEIEGLISADINADFDPNFSQQPEGEMTISIENFKLPASTLQIPMGGGLLPVPVPNTEITSVELRGKLKGGEFTIEDGVLGKTGDPIYGAIRGRIGLRLNRQGNFVMQDWGGYELKLKLNLNRDVERNFSTYLGFISQYKTTTASGASYALQLSAPNIRSNFNIGPIRNF